MPTATFPALPHHPIPFCLCLLIPRHFACTPHRSPSAHRGIRWGRAPGPAATQTHRHRRLGPSPTQLQCGPPSSHKLMGHYRQHAFLLANDCWKPPLHIKCHLHNSAQHCTTAAWPPVSTPPPAHTHRYCHPASAGTHAPPDACPSNDTRPTSRPRAPPPHPCAQPLSLRLHGCHPVSNPVF